MNFVVVFLNEYGISGFCYMYGKDEKEVNNLFTMQHPDKTIIGTYVSVANIREHMIGMCRSF